MSLNKQPGVFTDTAPPVGPPEEGISAAALRVSISAHGGGPVSAPMVAHSTVQGSINTISHHHHYHSSDPGPPTATQRTAMALDYKEWICSQYNLVQEYNSLPAEDVLLTERYTELLIVQRHRQQQEREEEIRSGLWGIPGDASDQLKDATYRPISVEQLFQPTEVGHDAPKAVILQGHSGHGKSFTVQRLMFDWASGLLFPEHFALVFHLQCRRLNHLSGQVSVGDLLSHGDLLQLCAPENVLFIIDGFDELHLSLEEPTAPSPKDPFTPAPVSATLSALLRGLVLPKASLLVTTRSTAVDRLSRLLKRPQRYTEILGFSEAGVREYFHRFCQDEQLAERVYNTVRLNETLFTSCFIPVICWIVCTVLREQLEVTVTTDLETTTSIFVRFVSTLLEHHCQALSQPVPTLLRSLGQLAERGVLEQRVLFEKESVLSTVSDPASVPFLCKFLLKKKVNQEEMFSFMHLSFQEFFTALYYTLNQEEEKVHALLQSIRAAQTDSHLRPIVQFLFGLSNKEVKRLLEASGVLLPRSSWLGFILSVLSISPSVSRQLEGWILSAVSEKRGAWEADMKLFVLKCLYELHEEAFVREAMEAWGEVAFRSIPLTRTDCWVLLYCLQCCPSIRSLRLTECNITAEKLRMLQPALSRCEELGLETEGLQDADVPDLIAALGEGKVLSIVRVSNSSLSDDSVRQVFSAFTRQKSVSRVALSVRSITLTTAELFFHVLQDVHLMWSALSTQEVQDRGSNTTSLCASLSVGQYMNTVCVTVGQKGLVHSSLSRVSLAITHTPQMFTSTKHWMEMLHKYHTLENICTLEYDEHVEALQSSLCALPGLKEVDLWVSCLTESWASRVLKFIHTCPSLQCCRVQWDSQSDSERESLCSSFSVRRETQAYIVSAAQLGQTLSRVCVTLPHTPEVESALWMDLLRRGHTLQDFTEDSPDYEECVDALFHCLASLPALSEVDLKVSCLTESWAFRILSLIHTCPSLRHIRFGISDHKGVLMEEALWLLQESPRRSDCTLTLTGHYGNQGADYTH